MDAFAQEAKQASRSVHRGIAPARQSASLDAEFIHAVDLPDEPRVEGGPTGPGRWATVAIFWVLREIEIAAARDTNWLVDAARERGIWVLSDEVYSRLVYDGSPHAPSFLDHAAPDDPLIVINSFSKAWSMTGWRLGWLITPPGLGDLLGKLTESHKLSICEVFTGLLLRRRMAVAGAVARRLTGSTGEPSSPGSSAPSEETPPVGSPASPQGL